MTIRRVSRIHIGLKSKRTLCNVEEGRPDKVLDSFGLGSIGNSLALGDLRCGIHLLKEIGDSKDAIGTLENGGNGLWGVQVGL